MQASGLTDITPVMCTSPAWRQYPVFSQPSASGCSLMAARLEGSLSSLSSSSGGGCYC